MGRRYRNVNLKEDVSVTNYLLTRVQKDSIGEEYLKSTFKLYPIKDLQKEGIPIANIDEYDDMTYYMKDTENYKKSEDPLFSGKIYVLIDKGCYSSTESFLLFCKKSHFATIVGAESSGGGGGGTQPMVYVMPNTGICYEFCLQASLNADGELDEQYGTTPDILVPEGKDVLEYCKMYILSQE